MVPLSRNPDTLIDGVQMENTLGQKFCCSDCNIWGLRQYQLNEKNEKRVAA